MGTAMVSCIAKKHQVPVIAFSESYKFSDKVNIDPIYNNEIGNPDAILQGKRKLQGLTPANDTSEILKLSKKAKETMLMLNMRYDMTKPEYISLVSWLFVYVYRLSVR